MNFTTYTEIQESTHVDTRNAMLVGSHYVFYEPWEQAKRHIKQVLEIRRKLK